MSTVKLPSVWIVVVLPVPRLSSRVTVPAMGAPAAAVPEMALALTLADDCALFVVVLPLDPPPPQAVRARAVAMRLAMVLILGLMMS